MHNNTQSAPGTESEGYTTVVEVTTIKKVTTRGGSDGGGSWNPFSRMRQALLSHGEDGHAAPSTMNDADVTSHSAQQEPRRIGHHDASTPMHALPDHSNRQHHGDSTTLPVASVVETVPARMAETRSGWREAEEAVPVEDTSTLMTYLGKRRAKDVHHYREQGIQLAKRGKYDKAEKLLERAMELGAEDSDTRIHMAFIRLKQKRYNEVIDLLESLNGTNPDDAGPATLLAMAHQNMGGYKKALKVLEPAARSNPQRFNIHYGIGLANMKLKRYDAALEAWSHAMKLRPADTNLRERIWALLELRSA
ncbi:MAG: tetratricopeptide repeat protein [Magnetococcales bacterium]|nr:tetratricopeptide repeat protein [Magnetococcales bacterium]